MVDNDKQNLKKKVLSPNIFGKVDVTEVISPLTLGEILERTGADMAFLATAAEELDLGKAPGVDFLADALLDEIASIAKVPMIEVARGGRGRKTGHSPR